MTRVGKRLNPRRWRPFAIIFAAAMLLTLTGAVASAVTPNQAEGDSYAVRGTASVLGNGPINVGPVQPAKAYTPPGTTNFAQSGAVSCTLLQPPCVNPLVSVIKVVADTAKATATSSPTTDCAPGVQLPNVPFVTGKLTGGNACSNIAHVSGLNTGTELVPVYNLDADGVTAQSLTQGCKIKPVGVINIVALSVFGTPIVGPQGLIDPNGLISPNTPVDIPGLAHVILNEQHFDSQGHGLTVNAVHVFLDSGIGALAGADIVLAHAHSEANCPDGTTVDTGKTPGNPNPQPVVMKLDSTKHANPGETVSYKVTIDDKGCAVTHIIDTLPPFFTYVPGSAKGPLGEPTVSVEQGSTQQQLEWYKATGLFSGTAVETYSAKIDPAAPDGQYINNVDGFSDCGEFNGEDLIALTSGPTTDQGPNPGIIVPRPGVVAQPPVELPPTTGGLSAAGSPAGAPLPLLAAMVLFAARLLWVSRKRRQAESA